ncbi:hypothetical protein B5M47_03710 [candidate division CPR3 bacterium 4484_211]|uniref:Uncharacterized protein n=1 Tax=candidate division CPR3 bacterium 4484_211 TaxID=1968527 RepID=A0A1W9NWR1_UNCC3|nr:MAG: hypothetical protein B5M47_03710 [candidate division CPR3 bacterium 4484_211]
MSKIQRILRIEPRPAFPPAFSGQSKQAKIPSPRPPFRPPRTRLSADREGDLWTSRFQVFLIRQGRIARLRQVWRQILLIYL